MEIVWESLTRHKQMYGKTKKYVSLGTSIFYVENSIKKERLLYMFHRLYIYKQPTSKLPAYSTSKISFCILQVFYTMYIDKLFT